jgi:hypothetical protein
VFALDPFCIRQNDRVLLETSMMFWVLLGYLVFSSLAGHPAPRGARLRAAGAGLAFGCAVLTKDEAALLTLLPLLAAGVLRWGPRRSLIVLTATTTVAVYAAYVAAVAAGGHLGVFWAAKAAGVQRLLGLLQVSGFHGPGGGSLTARLTAEAGSFLPTYAILVLAVPAALLVLRRGGHLPRILGLLYCAAGAALAYALIAGTLEEQELYLLVPPSLLIIPAAATLLPALNRMPSRPAHKKRRWPPRAAAMLSVLALAGGLNVWTCIQWARQPDDGFARLLRYMAAQVPPGTAVTVAAGSPIAGNSDGGRYALQAHYKAGLWATPAALRGEHVRYILAEWGSINEGFAYLSTGQVLRLGRPGREVFSFWGRTYGHLALYKLPSPAGQQPRRRQLR